MIFIYWQKDNLWHKKTFFVKNNALVFALRLRADNQIDRGSLINMIKDGMITTM